MLSNEDKVIDKVEKILASCPYNEKLYQEVLQELNPIVIRTAQVEEYRNSLANSFAIWKQLKTTLSGCIVEKIIKLNDEEHLYWYLRTIRGLIILMRNLSVSNQEIPQELLLQNVVVDLFAKVATFKFSYDDMETSTFIAITSFLHNITKKSVVFDKTSMKSLMIFLQYPLDHPQKQQELLFPYILYFVNLAGSDDFLYYFFRQDTCTNILYDFFVVQILNDHSTLSNYLKIGSADKQNLADTNINEELKPIDAALIRLFSKLAINESFCGFFEKLKDIDTKKTIDFLHIMQLVLTSSDKWNKFQLITILTWCYNIFEKLAADTTTYFSLKEDNEAQAKLIHEQLYSILDILVSLSKFEHALEFLNSYGALEILVPLLGLLQTNLVRINFTKDMSGKITKIKTTDSFGEKITEKSKLENRVDYTNNVIKSTNFPEIKSFIIELLANLSHKNKTNQDKIRELHGLETVLSNCVIDDNDPFIKERSIVCIRFLLEGNAENQKIVAELEAKGVVKNDDLEEAGFEVDVNKGGEIKLTAKAKQGE
ncbi:copper transport protein 86 [Monosporozyma servazzii]